MQGTPDGGCACCRVLCTSRALAVFPGLGFVSGSHDLTLRVWDMQGNTISELLGHTAIIYSVAVLPARNLIASGTGRGTLRMKGVCLQHAHHHSLQRVAHCSCCWSGARACSQVGQSTCPH